MPYQGHLYIGVRLYNYEQLSELYKRFGLVPSAFPSFPALTPEESLKSDSTDWLSPSPPKREMLLAGRVYNLHFGPILDTQEEWPPHPNSMGDPRYTSALFGFALTGRYFGSLLDAEEPNGAPEPFEIDVDLLVKILADVRVWWPEAQVLIMTEYH